MKPLLCILLGAVGCGAPNVSTFQINGLESYYGAFVAKTNHGSNNLIIKIAPVPCANTEPGTTVIGCCQFAQTPTVTLDPTYWSGASEADRQELVDHELGHCILGRAHRLDLLSNGQPASIMYPFHFSPLVIQAAETYYDQELVND